MLRPIKRVWVPPKPAPVPPTAVTTPADKPVATGKRALSDLPETEVEERNSDSIWAQFESVYAKANANKTNPV